MLVSPVPIKPNRLHSQVLLEVLPKRLAFRTSYFNSVRELMDIVQRQKPLIYKDLMSKLLMCYVL